MTVAQFESPGGTAEVQALNCFQRLKDFLDGVGQRFETTNYLTVEVMRPSNLDAVMKARRAVFGDRRPRTVSNRFTRLPPGELVRITARLDPARSVTASTPLSQRPR
jgi:enamine deaminase RidA (YjgF/YER057c/UK114 family)